jgi:hypothetical protein
MPAYAHARKSRHPVPDSAAASTTAWAERPIGAERPVRAERSVGAERSGTAERDLPAEPAGGPAERSVRAERSVGAERSARAERSVRAERAPATKPVGGAGVPVFPGCRGGSGAGGASRPRRPALAGLRLLGRGGLGEPIGRREAQGRSGAGRSRESGRRDGKARSSVHDRSEVDAHDCARCLAGRAGRTPREGGC